MGSRRDVLTTVLASATALVTCTVLAAVGARATAPCVRPEVVSHRGDPSFAPESTLAAYRSALRAGSQVVEVDIRFTRTSVPVVLHDPTVDRTTDGSGPVEAMTLGEVRRLDAGNGQPVPTLRQVLRLAEPYGATVLAELKGQPTGRQLTRFLSAVDGVGYADRLVVTSFHPTTLALVRARRPDLRTGFIGRPGRRYDPRWVASQASLFLPFADTVDAATTRDLHAAGVRVYPWTVDRAAQWRSLGRAGLDGVVTNRTRAYQAWARKACAA